jgi:hypothetical protein
MTPFDELVYPARCVWTAGILMKLKLNPSAVTAKELMSIPMEFIEGPFFEGDEGEGDQS